MGAAAATLAVGLFSGVLSGAFGIGGGLVTTPAIRLLLGFPALIAVGTPLPVILPGALTGAVTYWRRGSADVRSGVIMGLVGSVGSIGGALLSAQLGGTTVMLATAALVVYAAGDMLQQHRKASALTRVTGEAESDEALAVPVAVQGQESPARPTIARLAMVGAIAGLYSGFLGLGGGFIVVPGLTRYCGMSVKRAIGTSLVTVAVLAIPGTITHSLLGHIDWMLAAWLAVGVVPGAVIGARLTERASDSTVRLSFAALLIVAGLWLAISEVAGIVL